MYQSSSSAPPAPPSAVYSTKEFLAGNRLGFIGVPGTIDPDCSTPAPLNSGSVWYYLDGNKW